MIGLKKPATLGPTIGTAPFQQNRINRPEERAGQKQEIARIDRKPGESRDVAHAHDAGDAGKREGYSRELPAADGEFEQPPGERDYEKRQRGVEQGGVDRRRVTNAPVAEHGEPRGTDHPEGGERRKMAPDER